MSRRKLVFDCVLAGSIAAVALAGGLASAYADWAGCGQLTTAIMCDGCGGSVDGECGCHSGSCTDTSYVCTTLANGWNQCQAPASGKDICERERNCKERMSCNNSQGQPGGACAPGGDLPPVYVPVAMRVGPSFRSSAGLFPWCSPVGD